MQTASPVTIYNSGCGVLACDDATYGDQFNINKGGVNAIEWTSDYIRIWFWRRNGIPPDVNAGLFPVPSSWGTPLANFQGNCTIDEHFRDHMITFDTTFCGDYAGPTFSDDPTCRGLASSCVDFAANNPLAFADA